MHKSADASMLYYPQTGCVKSRDLFIFWEINGNISLTVQDTDIVAMEE